MEIILATNNSNKVKEFNSIFGNEIKLVTLKEIGYTKEIIEDGSTFVENSMIKCKTVYNEFRMPVLADDSGLCVEALNGEPGILSARFGGNGLTDADRYNLLLEKVKGEKNLNASFVCALVFYINPNRFFIVQEEVKGEITFDARGKNGFGYDPVFYIKEFGKTAAELTDAEKNSVSHRGKAAKAMKNIFTNVKI
jgi:XTP/dITP diphosphohydrolase